MNKLKVIANDLVPVYETDSKEKTVNARELHEFLNVATRYNDWIRNRVTKYGFEEGQDFITVTKNLVSGGKATIHYLKLDTAKELAMVENNEQGKKVRKYFIAVEKKAREMFTAPTNYVEALEAALTLAKQIEEQKPLVNFAKTVLSSEDSILIRALAKLASKDGITIGQNNLYRKLRKWGLLNSKNEPYQQYIDNGYFEVIERVIHTSEGPILKFTTKVLPKGQAYIIKRLRKEA